MLEVKFYDEVEDSLLHFAVIIAKHDNKWVFCKHKNRNTYEVPGGTRDEGEDILETAKRELYEETGAREYTMTPICAYSIFGNDGVIHNAVEKFGMVYYADIKTFDILPSFEMEKVEFFREVPKELTYPAVHPLILAKVDEKLNSLELKDKALNYLTKNQLLHMGMLEPIRRGTADILYANTDRVLLKEQSSGAYMISADSIDKGKELIDRLSECNLIVLHQLEVMKYAAMKYNLTNQLVCYQAVYMDKNKCKVKTDLDIKQLNLSEKDIVLEHYDKLSSKEIEKLINIGNLYGGYKDGKLIGFVGYHLEGSIGLLEVFPHYRFKGYGTTLEIYIINQMLDKGLVPFAQIEIDNLKSIALHEKLGFSISEDRLYWMF